MTAEPFIVIAFSKRDPGLNYFLSDFGWSVDPAERKLFKKREDADAAFSKIMKTARGKRDIYTAYIFEGKKEVYSYGSTFADMFRLRQLREKRRKLIKKIRLVMSENDIDFLGLNGENKHSEWWIKNSITRGSTDRQKLKKILSSLDL